MSETIDSIHTACKNCIFAEYNDMTQVGCHLHYIEKYKQKGIQILEAYDEEKEFYIVNNKKCLGYRENSWLKKRKLDNLCLGEQIAYFKLRNHLHYMAVVNLKTFDEKDLNDLATELKSLVIKPKKIVFIRHQQAGPEYGYDKIQALIDKSQLDCKWRIQTMLVDKSYMNILHEVATANKKYRFVLSVENPTKNLNQLVETGNNIVYNELDSFIVVTNTNKSALLFSASNYRYSLLIENKCILTTDSYHTII